MTQSLAAATQAVVPSDNNLRVGTVSAVNFVAGTADVVVGGVLFPDLTYLYALTPPPVGATVAVFRQESSWFVVGMLSGVTAAAAAASLRSIYGEALGLNYGNITWREAGTGGTIATGVGTTLIPGTSSRSIVKAYASTRVRIIQSITTFTSAVNTVIEFGCRVTGAFTTADVYLGRLPMNPTGTQTTGVGMGLVDSVIIPSGFVGTVTMAPIWKNVAGAGTTTFNSDGRSNVTAEEVP